MKSIGVNFIFIMIGGGMGLVKWRVQFRIGRMSVEVMCVGFYNFGVKMGFVFMDL